jgi:hypothetical protein
MGGSGRLGPIGRYLSGLCAAGLGLFAAGWIMLTPLAFGYRGRGSHVAALTNLATGGGLAVVCVITLIAWTVAWRRRLRADGLLTPPSPGQAAPDAHQVLAALTALLAPLQVPWANGSASANGSAAANGSAVANGNRSVSANGSAAAPAELLIPYGEEEAW